MKDGEGDICKNSKAKRHLLDGYARSCVFKAWDCHSGQVAFWFQAKKTLSPAQIAKKTTPQRGTLIVLDAGSVGTTRRHHFLSTALGEEADGKAIATSCMLGEALAPWHPSCPEQGPILQLWTQELLSSGAWLTSYKGCKTVFCFCACLTATEFFFQATTLG